MINKDKITSLTNLGRKDLAYILSESGYTGVSFEDARFLGLTESGDFVYLTAFYDDGGGPEDQLEQGKVYVKYNHKTGKLSADY